MKKKEEEEVRDGDEDENNTKLNSVTYGVSVTEKMVLQETFKKKKLRSH